MVCYKYIFMQGKSKQSVLAILDFMYTGTLTLDQNNAVDLLQTATALRVKKVHFICPKYCGYKFIILSIYEFQVVELCTDYIIHQIDCTNCLDILKLARIDKHEALEVMLITHSQI